MTNVALKEVAGLAQVSSDRIWSPCSTHTPSSLRPKRPVSAGPWKSTTPIFWRTPCDLSNWRLMRNFAMKRPLP